MMIPRDQTVSSWYTGHFLRLYTVGRILTCWTPEQVRQGGRDCSLGRCGGAGQVAGNGRLAAGKTPSASPPRPADVRQAWWGKREVVPGAGWYRDGRLGLVPGMAGWAWFRGWPAGPGSGDGRLGLVPGLAGGAGVGGWPAGAGAGER